VSPSHLGLRDEQDLFDASFLECEQGMTLRLYGESSKVDIPVNPDGFGEYKDPE